MFKKYMHLERFGTQEVEDIELGVVWVFPKLDGTNGQLWWEDGQLKAGSRNRELTVENDNAGFYNASLVDQRYSGFFKHNPTATLYGEWLVPHSLTTYRDDAWRKFYIFDMSVNDEFLEYDRYKGCLDVFGLDYLAPIATLKNPSYEQIQTCLDKNIHLIKDGMGIGEGIVLKNYNFVNRFGRVVWAKVIANHFKEQHHKVMGAPIINGDLIEEKIVEEFVTQHFVDKVYAKITLEHGWHSKMIPQLLGYVWYDLVKEEMWEILKKHKNPRIDMRLLNKFTIDKVKKLKGELF